MQVKMKAMEKREVMGGAYVNLEMLGISPFTQEIDDIMPPKGFKIPIKSHAKEWPIPSTTWRCFEQVCLSK